MTDFFRFYRLICDANLFLWTIVIVALQIMLQTIYIGQMQNAAQLKYIRFILESVHTFTIIWVPIFRLRWPQTRYMGRDSDGSYYISKCAILYFHPPPIPNLFHSPNLTPQLLPFQMSAPMTHSCLANCLWLLNQRSTHVWML